MEECPRCEKAQLDQNGLCGYCGLLSGPAQHDPELRAKARSLEALWARANGGAAGEVVVAQPAPRPPRRPTTPIAVVPKCVVLGGHGFALWPGEKCSLKFFDDAVVVEIERGDIEVPYAEVTEIDIGGPGAVRRGGGLIGGGFGLGGAAEGMLVATMLNTLTTRVTVHTGIVVRAGTRAELFLNHSASTPEQLRVQLSKPFALLRASQEERERAALAQSAVPPALPSPPFSPTAEIAQLAGLLEAGHISPDEFSLLKREILDRIANSS